MLEEEDPIKADKMNERVYFAMIMDRWFEYMNARQGHG